MPRWLQQLDPVSMRRALRFLPHPCLRSTTPKPIIPWPSLWAPSRQLPSPPRAQPPALRDHTSDPSLPAESATITRLLSSSTLSHAALASALRDAGARPTTPLLSALLRDPSLRPGQTIALLRWARSQRHEFRFDSALLALAVGTLGKAHCFATAWSLIFSSDSDTNTVEAYEELIRAYARAGMARAAERTYKIGQVRPDSNDTDSGVPGHLFDVLIAALCEERHVRVATDCVRRRKAEEPGWSPGVRCYSVVLQGWFRVQKLNEAELLWDKMRKEGIPATVVSYGVMIEGLCQTGWVDKAVELVAEMRREGVEPNGAICNSIIGALVEMKRFKEALGMVEKFPMYGLEPDISTYNLLVKGFCKAGDVAGANNVLKMMMGRRVSPTCTTYNYFFRFFTKSKKMEEGISLYNRLVQSGFGPDSLTYKLLIKVMQDNNNLASAVQLIYEMRKNGTNTDGIIGSMLIQMLCQLCRWEEACFEFEFMIKKGITPGRLTYQKLLKDLRRLGMLDMARKVSCLMGSLLPSMKMLGTYVQSEGERSYELRKTILRKAKAMSAVLKASRDQNKLSELKSSTKLAVDSANKLITDILKRVDTLDM